MNDSARCSLPTVRAEDWGKLIRDVAAVSSMLDQLLHYGLVLNAGPRG